MDVVLTEDVAHFARRARHFIERDRFSTNIIGVNLELQLGAEEEPAEGSFFALVLDGDSVVGIAMERPPRRLFLPRLPDGAAVALAGAIAASGRRPPGAGGEKTTVASFSRAWKQLTAEGSKVVRVTRLYLLETLRPPAGVPGAPRRAGVGDVACVLGFLQAFHGEASLGSPPPTEAFALSRLARREVFLWDFDGTPVALACVSAPAFGVARVGPVYTPPARRTSGYGSAVTAAASAGALAGGASHVILYADLANPTSNSIYKKIGYRPLLDSEERDFLSACSDG